MLNAEVWESEGSIGNHPIIRVKSGALKNVGRKHFGEAKLIKNGGGTRDFLWGGGGRRKEWWLVKEERNWGGPLTRRQTSWHFEGLKIGPQK